VATGGTNEDHLVQLWDTASGRAIKSLKGHTDNVFAVAFSPDKSLLVSGGHDHTLKLWDVKTGVELAQLGDQDNSWRAVFSPDGKYLASASMDGSVKLWTLQPGASARTQGAYQSVKAIAFSRDGKWLQPAATTTPSGCGELRQERGRNWALPIMWGASPFRRTENA